VLCSSLSADGGYYLFPECHEVAAVQLLTLNTTEEEDSDITVSLINWWYVTLSSGCRVKEPIDLPKKN